MSDVAAAGEPYQRPEADAVCASVRDFDTWPSSPDPGRGRSGDRIFPGQFQRMLVPGPEVEALLAPGQAVVVREALIPMSRRGTHRP